MIMNIRCSFGENKMTLEQLKQVIDRALKEQPEINKTEVRFVDESGSAYIGALRFKETDNGLYLDLISKVEERVIVWKPTNE